MAQLVVRGLDDDVKLLLQRRAASHGQSMEAEVRDILRDALKPNRRGTKGLGSQIAARFEKIGLRQDEEFSQPQGHSLKDPFEE